MNLDEQPKTKDELRHRQKVIWSEKEKRRERKIYSGDKGREEGGGGGGWSGKDRGGKKQRRELRVGRREAWY